MWDIFRSEKTTDLYVQLVVRVGAEGTWSDCSGTAGLCIDTSVYTCSTNTLFNLCPGGNNIRCCPAPAGIQSGSCYSDNIGLCGRTEDCSTTTITNKCPGPSGVTCCPVSGCPSGTTVCGSDCCSSDETCTTVSTTRACQEGPCGDRDYSARFMAIYNDYTYLQGQGSGNNIEFATAVLEFRNLFQTGAILDLKNCDPFLEPRRSCGLQFFGREVSIDVPGNVLFGMIGYLFFAERYGTFTSSFLTAAAGAAQAGLSATEAAIRLLDPDDWTFLSRFDPTCDSYAILAGSGAIEEYGVDITQEELTSYLGRPYSYLSDPSFEICENSAGSTTTQHPYGTYIDPGPSPATATSATCSEDPWPV